MQLSTDLHLRLERVQLLMQREGLDALLLTSNVNTLYLSGMIYQGLVVVPSEGSPKLLVRRPQHLPELSPDFVPMRKVEQLPELVHEALSWRHVGLELDEMSHTEAVRLMGILPQCQWTNCSPMMRMARMIKTPLEIETFRQTTRRHVEVYTQIPSLYRTGMTDLDLQIEVERLMRRHGSIGIFRTYGASMEIFMGSLIAGDNAQIPSPYDFAMGGEGCSALPIGANGTLLEEGLSVMVDMAGNYSPYISDLTRTFSVGRLPEEAYRLHELSCQLHREVMDQAAPGTSCADLYQETLSRVREAGAEAYFMGTKQQAQFVGHGIGLQINELPVLMGRSRDVLEVGMVIAYEPKFVLPGIGALGVENTYLVTEGGVENLTPMSEEIIDLTQAN